MDDHHAAAAAGVLRCLQHGTTTVADSGPTGAGAGALRAAGLRGIVHLEAFGRHTGDAAREAAIALAKRVTALDDDRDSRVQIGVSPHAPYTVGPDFWEALVNHPDLADRSWATHLAESPDESELLGSGTGPLAQLFAARGTEPGRWPGQGSPVARLDRAGVLRPGLIAAHCVHLDADDPARLAAAGVGVAHCPISNATLACGDAPIARLRDAGVTLGLGTDSPASAGDYDLRADARAAGPGASLTPAQIIELATLGGATTLGLDRLVGSIETGKRADLIAVTGAPGGADPHAAVLDPTARVSLVLVDGVVLLEDGEPVMLDQGAILARAATSRQRLTQGSRSPQE
jgi:5-methylthioadenosine/S-adenosylhomocysteine deaminase